MIKIKHFFLLLCIAGCFAACTKDSTYVDNFDYEGQFKTDTALIRKFITDNKIPAMKDKSGVFYQIIAPGTGTVVYNKATQITFNYEGKLLNGTVFDSNTDVTKPSIFALGNLILGWQYGIPYIQKGGKIRMFIPSYYGYGNAASNKIPANSVLDFTVTLQ